MAVVVERWEERRDRQHPFLRHHPAEPTYFPLKPIDLADSR